MIKLHSMTGTTDYINKNQQVFNVSFMHLEVKSMQIRIPARLLTRSALSKLSLGEGQNLF